MNDRELLDETILRRSMRLETDEALPRFDAAAIAALATRRPPTMRIVSAGLSVAVVTGVVAGAVWSLIFAAAPTVANEVMDGALSAAVSIATLLVPIAQIAAEPAVPLSLLAALGVAILHELRERREHAHVNAS